ncbi:MAG: ABC transporter permease [Micrococcus sp.]|nr:ABC transporter permease [Micrococcus sp.]
MPPVRVRTGPGAGMYGGNVRAVLGRGFQALRTSNWAIFASGFFEPVLYLLSLGLGLGGLIGQVEGPGGPVSYGQYIAPALLAVSAMNGAIYDSTWNVFFRMRLSKLYQTMLNTSLGPMDVALGEITMALIRGGLYSVAFLVVMAALGLVTSWWAVLLIPAAVLVAFAFAAVGMAVTSYLTTFQQMDWIMLVLMPMFLFSATFFPLSVYPEPVQWLIQALPLWHGVELMRQLSAGVLSPFTAVHLLYFVVMIVLGLLFTAHRLRALFLR